MTKIVSNTLSRWHKIADRIRKEGVLLQQDINQAVCAGNNIDFDTFDVRKDTLLAGAALALGAKLATYLRLQDTLFHIRKSLAHVNIKANISDLLNEQEQTKQLLEFFTILIESTASAMSVPDFVNLGQKKAAQLSVQQDALGRVRRIHSNQSAVALLTPERMEELLKARGILKIKLNGLADKLADANATKLELTIDLEVATLIGL
jgi:hypothetical protein